LILTTLESALNYAHEATRAHTYANIEYAGQP